MDEKKIKEMEETLETLKSSTVDAIEKTSGLMLESFDQLDKEIRQKEFLQKSIAKSIMGVMIDSVKENIKSPDDLHKFLESSPLAKMLLDSLVSYMELGVTFGYMCKKEKKEEKDADETRPS